MSDLNKEIDVNFDDKTRTFSVNHGEKETVKGIAGATAINVASEVTTGKTWGENIAQSTGMNPNLGEFINPGFIPGSIFKFLKPSV